jgi:hypothetical protein
MDSSVCQRRFAQKPCGFSKRREEVSAPSLTETPGDSPGGEGICISAPNVNERLWIHYGRIGGVRERMYQFLISRKP